MSSYSVGNKAVLLHVWREMTLSWEVGHGKAAVSVSVLTPPPSYTQAIAFNVKN